MKKRIIPIALAIALTLTGCAGADAPATGAAEESSTGASDSTATDAADTAPAEEVTPVPDLVGNWKQSNPANEDSYQQATITADTISVDWVSDGGDTTSIYWVGTFAAPTDGSEPSTITSQRDAAATDTAMMASSDDTKEFTLEGDTISYKVSLLGTTTTVRLQKN